MATIKTSGDLLSSIGTDLADNNAGSISAEDVRSNMEDAVASINTVVASGNTDTVTPFTFDVRAEVQDPGGSPYGGTFIAESGIEFPNAPTNSSSKQIEPFLGVGGLDHRDLGNLNDGDPHEQYVSISGHRPMIGNLAVGNNWIGASGNSNMGIKFAPNAGGTEDILVSGDMTFGDNSVINTGKGVAQAWINFDASGIANIPVVRSAHNVTELTKVAAGKFRIKFAADIFTDNTYVAMGNSNGTSASGNLEDFDINTVGLVSRSGVDPNRTISFVVRNDAGQYVDAEINELVVFGNGPNVSSDSVTVN